MTGSATCAGEGRGGDAHAHGLTGGTRMHSARSAAAGHTCARARARAPLPRHTRVRAHMQLRSLPRRTHARGTRDNPRVSPPPLPESPPAPVPVLAGRPLAELAEVLVQPGAAGVAEPQRQGQPQQRAQQQGGGQCAPPCGDWHVSPPLAAPHTSSGHTKPHSLRGACLPLALTSLQGGGAAVLAAPRAGALAGRGGPAPLAVAVPVVVAHLGGVTPSLSPRQAPTSSTHPPVPHSPRARGTCSGTAGHPAWKRPGTGAGGTSAGGRGVSTGQAPPCSPGPFPPPWHSPSRGHRRCRAAPWLHRSHPHPWAGGSPGRTLLVCPRGCCCAGTAASRSRRPCRDRGVGGGGT